MIETQIKDLNPADVQAHFIRFCAVFELITPIDS